jgi:hypothetical protein
MLRLIALASFLAYSNKKAKPMPQALLRQSGFYLETWRV